jgi:muramoyltetrapeptide carboxypeptidase
MNLKRNGYFSQLKGLIVGGMTDMHDNEIPYGMNEKQIILDIVKEYDFPVVFDFPAGHIQDNRALLLGKEVSLQADKNQVIFNYIK